MNNDKEEHLADFELIAKLRLENSGLQEENKSLKNEIILHKEAYDRHIREIEKLKDKIVNLTEHNAENISFAVANREQELEYEYAGMIIELSKLRRIKGGDTEYILCSAIWFDDGNRYAHQPNNIETGIILCGHRHGCIFAQIGGLVKERQNLGIYEKEQGFLTNFNRFVDRTEAAKIAFAAGQTENKIKTLYSEHLW